jgi:hypothetical protein
MLGHNVPGGIDGQADQRRGQRPGSIVELLPLGETLIGPVVHVIVINAVRDSDNRARFVAHELIAGGRWLATVV